MKVISINVKTDSFVIDSLDINYKEKSNINTNNLVEDTFYYSERFIKRNKNIIRDKLNSKNINTAIYKDFNSFIILSGLLETMNIKIDVNRTLTPSVMDVLLDNSYLKTLECYFMPSDYVHDLAQRGISIKFFNKVVFTPNFVSSKNLRDLRGIYYRRVIDFYNEEDLYKNFENFLSVNNSLRFINLHFYSNDGLTYIVDTLNERVKMNVDIFIYQNDDNFSDISSNVKFLRKLNKEYSNRFAREIRIVYSNKFFRENIFRELTINGLKVCMVAVLYLGIVFMLSNKYHEYVALLNLRLLESSLAEPSEDLNIDDMDDEEVNPPVEVPPEENTPEPEPPKEYVNYYANIPTTFDKLLSINEDVVGWIKLNNTKVNYPVTKYSDNQYYLDHDIYKREIITGWVFMDYRNDSVNLNKNTIIYGHNLISGYMFGDLKNVVKWDWYTNPDNQVIAFNTLGKEMRWRIFSIYRTDYTTDYLKTAFYDDESFMNFVSMVKDRSIYNFNVKVDPDDKILTLSTCTGSNDRRLAVHAVLID